MRIESVVKGLSGAVLGWLAVRTALRRVRWMDLDSRVVLITGGARGLGLALAREFGERGARIILWARSVNDLAAAEQDLKTRNIDVLCQSCDIKEPLQIGKALEEAKSFGEVDVLVNNAGIIQVGPLESMTDEDYEAALATHFWGPLFTTNAIGPLMRARGYGRIVNISSIGGLTAVPHLPAYCASKFALVGLSRSLRIELANSGVFVTTVCPGLMRTGSARNASFKSRHRDEYAWFSVGSSIPGLAMHAETAAQRIVQACCEGRPELQLSIATRLAAVGAAVSPELTAEVLSRVNCLLPEYGGLGKEQALGHQSEGAVSQSLLTHFGRKAAVENNEV